MAIVPNLGLRSSRPAQWLISQLADTVCATRQPDAQADHRIRVAMGNVIAVARVLDLQELAEHPPPPVLQDQLPFEVARHWRELQSVADFDEHHLVLLLERHPELARYRSKPVTGRPAESGGP